MAQILYRSCYPQRLNLIRREVLSVQLFKREGVRLIDVVRGDVSLRHALKDHGA